MRHFTEYCLELFNNNTNFIFNRFLLKYSFYFLDYIILVACLSMKLFFDVVKILHVYHKNIMKLSGMTKNPGMMT